MDVRQALHAVVSEGEALSRDDAAGLMRALLADGLQDVEIVDLLTALHERGETTAELAGFSDAMRAASIPLPLTEAERDDIVDTCGTGGDGSGSFNISTAVALVAAAARVRVAKHGNRKVTSRCGSADVLEALGIPVEQTPEQAPEALRSDGFAFLLATAMHPAMRRVAAIRRSLPFRTVFNLLGPMTNPAGARRQVIGVYSAEAMSLVAGALAERGDMLHVLVVHGDGGLDELSLSGSSRVAEVKGSALRHFEITPEDAGLSSSTASLPGGDVAQNAAILRAVFAGEQGAARDIVVLNAAAVLMVAGKAHDLRTAVKLAADVLDRGTVAAYVAQLSHK